MFGVDEVLLDEEMAVSGSTEW